MDTANVSTKPRQGVRWYFATGEPDGDGIFDSLGNRLASWPRGCEPTSTNLNIAFKIIAAMPRYGIVISDKALRQAFDEARLSAGFPACSPRQVPSQSRPSHAIRESISQGLGNQLAP
jgi:hypothetical protein